MSQKIKFLSIILGVLVISFSVGLIVFGWTEPSASPPTPNVFAPVNVGPIVQWKRGAFGVSTAAIPPAIGLTDIAASVFRDSDNVNWYVDPNGISVFSGNVGIGTTSPTAGKLVVESVGGSFFGLVVKSTNATRYSSTDYITTAGGTGFQVGIYGPANANPNKAFLYQPGANPIGFFISGSEKVTIAGTGNVGIGTTTPGQKLSVAGTLGVLEGGASPSLYSTFQGGDQAANITYTLPTTQGAASTFLQNNGSGALTWAPAVGGLTWPLRAPDGIAAAPSYSFTNDPDMGIYRGGVDIFKIATAGTDKMTINAAGNVGIGTTNPSEKLEVAGVIAATGYINTAPSVNCFAPSLGTWYKNTTGRTIVQYGFIQAPLGFWYVVRVDLSPDDGATYSILGMWGTGSPDIAETITATIIVPNNWSYKYSKAIGYPSGSPAFPRSCEQTL